MIAAISSRAQERPRTSERVDKPSTPDLVNPGKESRFREHRSRGPEVLVDCGLFQGQKELRERNWQALPFNPAELNALLLTHAHIDHSGYIPRLVRDGFDALPLLRQAHEVRVLWINPQNGTIGRGDIAPRSAQVSPVMA
jgi:glyoxylase-like metal-dependent hydrolase (beta-lactamase superfamily II)